MRHGANDTKRVPMKLMRWVLAMAMVIGLGAVEVSAATSWISTNTDAAVSSKRDPFMGWVYRLTRDTRGRFVATGTFNNRIMVYRANPDMTPDYSFGIAGWMNYHLGSFTTVGAYAVATQPDGKIVIGGWGTNGTNKFLVIRLNEGGSYDFSFGSSGYVWTDFAGSTQAAITGIAVQKDGKIVAGGSAKIGKRWMFALARYTADGRPDATFDGDGKVLTDFTASNGASAYDMVLMADGRIVMGGHVELCGAYDWWANCTAITTGFALARYNPNGSLDQTFDKNGKVRGEIFMSADREDIHGLAVDSLQRIVAVGEAHIPAGDGRWVDSVDFALARFNLDGTLDKTFDGDGKVLTHFPWRLNGGGSARGVAIDGNRRIVVVGEAINGYGTIKTGYRMDGSLDPTFDDADDFRGAEWNWDGVVRQRSLQAVVVVNGVPVYAESLR